MHDSNHDSETVTNGWPPLPELPESISSRLTHIRAKTPWGLTVGEALAHLQACDFYLREKCFNLPDGFAREVLDDWAYFTHEFARLHFKAFKFAPGAEQFMALVMAHDLDAGQDGFRKPYCSALLKIVSRAALRRGVARRDLFPLAFETFIAEVAEDGTLPALFAPAEAGKSPKGAAGKGTPKPRTPKRPRGAPNRYDAEEDRRIRDAWNSGEYNKHQELGNQLGMTGDDVERALQRDHKRRRASE